MRTQVLLILLLVVMLAPFVAGQDGAVRSAVLEYADDIYGIRVLNSRGRDVGEVSLGYRFRQGESLRTGSSGGAEVLLQPNSSILRIGPDTFFRFDDFAPRTFLGANQFSVYAGRVRMVAANIGESRYLIRTPSTAAGVRGTDFIVEVLLGERESIIVRDGSVEVLSKASRRSVIVEAGSVANLDEQGGFEDLEVLTLSEWEAIVDFDADEFFYDLEFEELDVEDVFDDEFYDGSFEYFDDWMDDNSEDDFFENYEWDDEYLEDEFFDGADWLWEDGSSEDDLFDDHVSDDANDES